MMQVNEPVSVPKASDDNAERKLWLDYIRILNERAFSAAQFGVTDWGILAALAAIWTQSSTQIEVFVSSSDLLRNTFSATLFLLQSVVCLKGALWFSTKPISGGRTSLVLHPLVNRVTTTYGAYQFVRTIALFTGNLLSTHFVTGTPRKLAIAACVYLATDAIVSFAVGVRQMRKRGIDAPLLAPGVLLDGGSVPLASASMLAIGASAMGYGFIVVLRHCMGAHIGAWVVFKASVVCVVSFLLAGKLVERYFERFAQPLFLQLERDIMLYSLAVPEIKKRFFSDLAGKPVDQWYSELQHDLSVTQGQLDSLACKVKANVGAERIAPGLLTELRKELSRIHRAIEALTPELPGGRIWDVVPAEFLGDAGAILSGADSKLLKLKQGVEQLQRDLTKIKATSTDR